MRAIIRSAPDRLDEEVRRFQQKPITRTAFLNGVPKCGTHLLRNIVRMFVPVEQHTVREFIQIPNLEQYKGVFARERPQFSVGHMLFADPSATALKHAHHVILVRDPYDHVLARTRMTDKPEAEGFFRVLQQKFGIGPLPADWRERVRIGADRKHSATARENLGNAPSLPKTLPEPQRKLVDYAAPGLREMLGYA